MAYVKKPLVDSSSAILLYKAGLFERLTEIYQVMLTEVVFAELTCAGYPGAGVFKESAVTLFCPVSAAGIDQSLGKGERDTIAGYLQGFGDFVLIDDGSGARYCKEKGIPFINALLVPKVLFLAGIMEEAEQHGKRELLMNIGRYSRKVVEYAADCGRKELEPFIPLI